MTNCIKCTATTQQGKPCRSWAVHGTDPPRCVAHGGGSGKHGAPKGNQNARKHGYYAGASTAFPSLNLPAARAPHIRQSAEEQRASPGDNPANVRTLSDLKGTMSTVARGLYEKHRFLSSYIDERATYLTTQEYIHLLNLYAQISSRLGRLLRDQIMVSLHFPGSVDAELRQMVKSLGDRAEVRPDEDGDALPESENQT